MQRCCKVSGQTRSGEALSVGTIALTCSCVRIAWFCSMLAHKQPDSAAVHLGELVLPGNFIHIQGKVEFMSEKSC